MNFVKILFHTKLKYKKSFFPTSIDTGVRPRVKRVDNANEDKLEKKGKIEYRTLSRRDFLLAPTGRDPYKAWYKNRGHEEWMTRSSSRDGDGDGGLRDGPRAVRDSNALMV